VVFSAAFCNRWGVWLRAATLSRLRLRRGARTVSGLLPRGRGIGDLWPLVGCGQGSGVASAVCPRALMKVRGRPGPDQRHALLVRRFERGVPASCPALCHPHIAPAISVRPRRARNSSFIAVTRPARPRPFAASPNSDAPCGWHVLGPDLWRRLPRHLSRPVLARVGPPAGRDHPHRAKAEPPTDGPVARRRDRPRPFLAAARLWLWRQAQPGRQGCQWIAPSVRATTGEGRAEGGYVRQCGGRNTGRDRPDSRHRLQTARRPLRLGGAAEISGEGVDARRRPPGLDRWRHVGRLSANCPTSRSRGIRACAGRSAASASATSRPIV
jgi:hypothetical protein